METKQEKTYQEWLNPTTMHAASLNWLSELKFAKDEELFFNDLVKSYTLQLTDLKHFDESKKIVDRLSNLQKETNLLINKIIKHEKGLKTMLDGSIQLKEEAIYKEEHRMFIMLVSNFHKSYKTLKTQLFALIKNILKEGKQKRLLQ